MRSRFRTSPPLQSGTSTAGRAPSGNRTIGLGDSITLGDSDAGIPSRGSRDPLAWASLADPKVVYARNAGVPSDSAALMLARIQTDVIAYAPDWCVVNAGTNEAGNSVALATYATDVKALVAALRSNDIKPVLTTVLPHANTTRQGFIDTYNAWLAYYCGREGIPLVDWHAALVNPATGGILAAYDLDGIHPTAAGAKVMGDLLAAKLGPLYPTWAPPLATHEAAGAKNLLAGGCFITDTNADGLADNWSSSGGASTKTRTLDSAVPGNWQRITSAATTDAYLTQAFTGWSVGDVLAICGRVSADVSTLAGTFSIQVNFTGGTPSTARVFNLWSEDVTDGVFYMEVPVPAGSTVATVFVIDGGDSDAGTGYVEVAQLTVLNLTVLGAVAA